MGLGVWVGRKCRKSGRRCRLWEGGSSVCEYVVSDWAYLSKVVHPRVFCLVLQVVGDDDDKLHLGQELRDILSNAEAIHGCCRASYG